DDRDRSAESARGRPGGRRLRIARTRRSPEGVAAGAVTSLALMLRRSEHLGGRRVRRNVVRSTRVPRPFVDDQAPEYRLGAGDSVRLEPNTLRDDVAEVQGALLALDQGPAPRAAARVARVQGPPGRDRDLDPGMREGSVVVVLPRRAPQD